MIIDPWPDPQYAARNDHRTACHSRCQHDQHPRARNSLESAEHDDVCLPPLQRPRNKDAPLKVRPDRYYSVRTFVFPGMSWRDTGCLLPSRGVREARSLPARRQSRTLERGQLTLGRVSHGRKSGSALMAKGGQARMVNSAGCVPSPERSDLLCVGTQAEYGMCPVHQAQGEVGRSRDQPVGRLRNAGAEAAQIR
jgi:hypothetical protein